MADVDKHTESEAEINEYPVVLGENVDEQKQDVEEMTKRVGDDSVFILLRGEEQSQTDDDYLLEFKQFGLKAVHVPVLSFEYFNLDKLKETITRAQNYSGIILPSPRIVQALVKAFDAEDDEITSAQFRKWKESLILCPGLKTAHLSKKLLSLPSSLELNQVQVGTGTELADYVISNFKSRIRKPLFMPSSSIASNTIPKLLAEHEISVEVLNVYNTLPNLNAIANIISLFREFENKTFYLVFFSPSGFKSISTEILAACKFKCIAIGPVTSKYILDTGFDVCCTSDKPNEKHLVKSILKYFQSIQ